MDGRIVKEDTMECGMHSTESWLFVVAGGPDEGLSIIWLHIRGESSNGGHIGVESRSQGVGGGEMEEADSLLDRVGMGRSGSGLVRDSGDLSVEVWEGEMWMVRGSEVTDVLSRGTESSTSALVGPDSS